MRYVSKAIFSALVILAIPGCATIEKKVTGPGGYSYTEKITASGKSNIEEATQTFGGRLKVDSPDGLKVEAELDSGATGKNLESDNSVAPMMALFFQWLLQQTQRSVIP